MLAPNALDPSIFKKSTNFYSCRTFDTIATYTVRGEFSDVSSRQHTSILHLYSNYLPYLHHTQYSLKVQTNPHQQLIRNLDSKIDYLPEF